MLAAVRALTGFLTNSLAGNDDGSVGPVSLGFAAPINYFGTSTTTAFVNNNGNITFDSVLSTYTPFTLNNTDRKILAPFFADVDTRGGAVVRYGTDLVDGHAAFGVEWPGVGFYDANQTKRNTFELIIIDRSDTGPGNFDVEFNYDQIQWESGSASGGTNGLGGSSARVGFASGLNGPFREFVGSAVNGALLDTNQVSGLIRNSYRSDQPGRYVLTVRQGAVVDPDLQVGNVTITPSPPMSGNEVTVQWIDSNTGNDATPTRWSDRVVVKHRTSGAVLFDQMVLYDPLTEGNGSLLPGQQRTRSTTFRLPDGIPGTGIFDVNVTVDALSQIFEANSNNTSESNNSAAGSFEATLAPYPDLTAALQPVPATASLLEQIAIAFDVANGGSRETRASWRDQVYLSSTPTLTPSSQLLGSFGSVNQLQVGGTYRQNVDVSLPANVEGDYYLIAVSNGDGGIFELVTANNISAQPIKILRPDLHASSVVVPETAVFGSNMQINWSESNLGPGNWLPTNGQVQFWLSSDETLSDTDVSLGTEALSPLTNGNERNRSFTAVLPLNLQVVPGQYRIIVRLDSGNVLSEPDELNNTSVSGPITVSLPPLPDLQVTDIVSPRGTLSGRPIELSWTITNAGTAVANGPWLDRVYLSADDQIGSDLLLGQFTFDAFVHPNQAITRTQIMSSPLDISGDYWIIVRTDAAGGVYEHNLEDNNTTVDDLPIQVTLSPTPNLIVDEVIVPSTAFSGQRTQVEWIIKNVGTGPTNSASWFDAVYLSTDTTFDNSDRFMGSVDNSSYLNPNEAYRSELEVTLPVGIEGAHYFIIVSDSGNRVVELGSGESDNSRLDTATAVTLTPPPDLRVLSLTAPAQAFSGSSINLSWTVANNGTGDTLSGRWTDEVYVSFNGDTLDNADTWLGRVMHEGNLTVGGRYTVSGFSVTLPLRFSGEAHFIVRTDALQQEYEHALEGNNVFVRAAPTQVALTPPPDLQVARLTAPAQAIAGRALNLEYETVNHGLSLTPVSSWNDAFYLSADDIIDPNNDTLLGVRNRNGALDVDQAQLLSRSFTLPTGLQGDYFVYVVVDRYDDIFELDEVNNQSVAVPIRIAQVPPDLSVEVAKIGTTTSGPINAGDAISLTYTVKNIGAGATFGLGWTDRVYLSSDDQFSSTEDQLLSQISIGGTLQPAASYERLSQAASIPLSVATGDYHVFIVADADDEVPELDDLNNASQPQLLSVRRELSDLTVAGVTAPSSALSTSTLSVTWEVSNNGTMRTVATDWQDQVWLSVDQTIDANDILLGSVQRSGSLNNGESYTVSREFAVDRDLQGSYFVIVATDAGSRVVEQNELNNSTSTSGNAGGGDGKTVVTLGPTADLVASNIQIPASAFSGQEMSIIWTVSNNGLAVASGRWNDTVYLSLDQVFDATSDIPLGTRVRNGDLGVGSTYNVTTSMPIPVGIGGRYYLFVNTDSNDRVYERNAESNNSRLAAATINVILTPPADFTVGVITIPTNALPGANTSVTFTVNNQGANPAQGQWYDAVYFSSDETWDIDDSFLGRVLHVGTVDAGTSYTSTLTARLPGIVPGDYHVILRSDIRNNVVENNESNNLRASLDRTNIDVASLVLGTPTAGQLESGRSVYYKVEVPAGETVVIEFQSSATAGFTELYASYAQMPSRSRFDFAANTPFEPNQRIVIPSTLGGTYYVQAYGNSVPNPPTDFNIVAKVVQFSVFDTNFGRGGTAGNRTIKINGAKFDRTLQASLITSSGQRLNASAVLVESDTRAFATFDLRSMTAGVVSVEVSRDDGQQVNAPDSFTIVQNIGIAAPVINIAVPDSVRRLAAYQFTVYWANDSINDIPVPYLKVGNSVAFKPLVPPLDGARLNEFFATGTGGGPLNILRPGQSGSIVYTSSANTARTSHTVSVDVRDQFGSDRFNWDELRGLLYPSGLSDEQWQTELSALQSSIGSNWRQVLASARVNLAKLGDDAERATIYEALAPSLAQLITDRSPASISGSISSPNLYVSPNGWSVIAINTATEATYSTITRPDGSFTIAGLTAGEYRLELQLGSVRQLASVTRTLAAGDALAGLMIEVQALSPVKVQVQSDTGVPLTAARVSVFHQGRLMASEDVDAASIATFVGMAPGDYQLVVSSEGRAIAAENVTLSTSNTSLLIKLPTSRSQSGSVTFSGAPVSYTVVAVRTDVAVPLRSIAQNNAGGFTFSNLADGTYTFTAFAAGYEPVELSDIEVTASNAPLVVNFVASQAGGEGEDTIPLWFAVQFAKLVAIAIYPAPSLSTAWNKFLAAPDMSTFILWFEMRQLTMVGVEGASRVDGISIALYLRYFDSLGSQGKVGFAPSSGMQSEVEDNFKSSMQSALQAAIEKIRQSEEWSKEFDCDEGNSADYGIMQLVNELGADPQSFAVAGPTGALESTIASRSPARGTRWGMGAYGPAGVLAGGNGSWGTKGSNQSEIADWRMIDGNVHVSLDGKSTEAKVKADWKFVISDAVDFEPGNTNVGGYNVLAGLKTLENLGMTWDVPFQFSTEIELDTESFNIQRKSDCDACKSATPPANCKDVPIVNSMDPNDIIGPVGYGPEHWVAANIPLGYMIRFENDPLLASAPAQIVSVTQTLDEDLDPRSFRLGSFGFGEMVFEVPANKAFLSTRLDLIETHGIFVDVFAGIDPQTREVFWTLTSIDPETGELPVDPLRGFLPLNLTSPQGEGFVTYTVKARATAVTGTRIDAEATIVFDQNAPIDTPAIFNTLDAGLPATSIEPLTNLSVPGEFTVTWSGDDGNDASGLAGYTVYVSQNGTDYVPWLTGTQLTSAIYLGQPSSDYRFYIVADDNAGNRSQASEIASLNVAALRPWQNELDPIDVNASGEVSPLDALLIINSINTFGSRQLVNGVDLVPPYIDVNGDGFVSPIDALIVINYINLHPNGEGETAPSQTGNLPEEPLDALIDWATYGDLDWIENIVPRRKWIAFPLR